MDEGLALIVAGQGAAAAEIFRAMLRDNPEHYGAQYQLARALDIAGLPVEARAEWEKSLVLAERSQDSTTIAAVRERLLRSDDMSHDQLMARGVNLLYVKNEADSAVMMFREILANAPEHYGAMFQLARALDRAGRTAEARAAWERFLPVAEAQGDTQNAALARTQLGR